MFLNTDKTVFVLVTDERYLYQTKNTIIDIRSRGQWHGDLVLICIDIPNLNPNFADFYNITVKRFPQIEAKKELLKLLHHTPFHDTIDGREINKINQWEKLHVLDVYFKQWDRVVFVDAGLRVLENVHETILRLDYKGKFLAPDDGGNYVPSPNPDKLFKTQVSHALPENIHKLKQDFGQNILEQPYFLNCIWVYDTSILDVVSKEEMIEGMQKYPICKTNEMTMMNLIIHFKHKLWQPFPKYTPYIPNVSPIGLQRKILFEWNEANNPEKTNWRDYCFMKYPATITFDDT